MRLRHILIELPVFVSGKIVLTGAKVREEIYQAFELIYPVLSMYPRNTGTISEMFANCTQATSVSREEYASLWTSFGPLSTRYHSSPSGHRPSSVLACLFTPVCSAALHGVSVHPFGMGGFLPRLSKTFPLTQLDICTRNICAVVRWEFTTSGNLRSRRGCLHLVPSSLLYTRYDYSAMKWRKRTRD